MRTPQRQARRSGRTLVELAPVDNVTGTGGARACVWRWTWFPAFVFVGVTPAVPRVASVT